MFILTEVEHTLDASSIGFSELAAHIRFLQLS